MKFKISTALFVLKFSLLMSVLVTGHIVKKKNNVLREKDNLTKLHSDTINTPIATFIRNLYN